MSESSQLIGKKRKNENSDSPLEKKPKLSNILPLMSMQYIY